MKIITLLMALFLFGCGVTPNTTEEFVTYKHDLISASCLSGQNPFTTNFPIRTTCTWQPVSTITPISSNVEYCVPGIVPPANRIDIFDIPFINGLPPYNYGNCARLVVPTGSTGYIWNYNFLLAAGWLTPNRWIRSFIAGEHVQTFYFNKTPCITTSCGASVSNAGFSFIIANVTGQYGADFQIATMRAVQVP